MIAGLFPHLARGLHHRGLAGAGAADYGCDSLPIRHMRDGCALLIRQPFVTSKHLRQHLLPDAEPRRPGEVRGTTDHLGFKPDHRPRRQPRRCPLTGSKIYGLGFETQAFRALQELRQQALEAAHIVNIAMQHLGEIAFIENALFLADHVEHDSGLLRDPPGVDLPPGLLLLQTFELGAPSRLLGLASDCRGANPDMDRRHDVDPALGVGSSINPNIETSQRQMLVLQIEPGIALLQELGLLAGPQTILDFAGLGADRLSVGADGGNLLGAKPRIAQRAQCRHQMNMRIARFVVIDPVSHLPPRQHLLEDELAHQGNVLLARQLHRQGNDEFLGELRIGAFLERFHPVPERLGRTGNGTIGDHFTRPGWRIGRQQKLLMGQIAFGRIVDGPRLSLIVHFRTVPIRRRQHGAAAIAASDQLRRKMRDGQGDTNLDG